MVEELGCQVSIPFIGSGVPQETNWDRLRTQLDVSIPFIGSGVPQGTPFSPLATTRVEGCVYKGVEKKVG
ncbi:MAG: hypothetical protein ACYS6K_26255, partial [Planctomycetota bacterium]